MAKGTKPIPKGYHSITPQLTLDNAAQSIDWYTRAMGAEELGRSEGPDGKIIHAELRFGDSRVIVNDVIPGHGKGPQGYGGSPANLWLYVPDGDAVFSRAVSAGAKVQVPMTDQFWGDRAGALTDPAGYVWWIATHKEDLSRAEIEERGEATFKQPAASAAR
jgi:PhnB protein